MERCANRTMRKCAKGRNNSLKRVLRLCADKGPAISSGRRKCHGIPAHRRNARGVPTKAARRQTIVGNEVDEIAGEIDTERAEAKDEIHDAHQTTVGGGSSLEANEGRWQGILVKFGKFGNPIELPPQYVPDALREWGETLYEWNTKCDCEVHSDKLSMKQITQRQIPLSGCESACAQYEVESQFDTVDEGVALLTLDNGSYTCGPKCFGADVKQNNFEVDTCFHTGSGKRIRLCHAFVNRLGNSFSLDHVKMYVEDRLENRNDEVVDTDGGVRQTGGLADQPCLDASILDNSWGSVPGTHLVCNAGGQSVPSQAHEDSEQCKESSTILLPLNVWSKVHSSGNSLERLVIEVGMVDASGEAMQVCKQNYEKCQLKTLEMGEDILM